MNQNDQAFWGLNVCLALLILAFWMHITNLDAHKHCWLNHSGVEECEATFADPTPVDTTNGRDIIIPQFVRGRNGFDSFLELARAKDWTRVRFPTPPIILCYFTQSQNLMPTFSTSGKTTAFKFMFKDWQDEQEYEFGMIGRFLYMAEQRGERWLYYKISPSSLSKEDYAKYVHELLKL